MPLPNFLVIGAGRSGTTSLNHYLKQHPEIYIPDVKSPSHFYCQGLVPPDDPYRYWGTRSYFVPDPRAYKALFDGVRGEKAIGEVSPVYLAAVHVAPRIANRLPHARLVAILRNPVDRVYARYVGRRRDGLEPQTDFAELVRAERRQPLIRDDASGTYLAGGIVSHFLQTYYAHFSQSQIRIYLFDDFQKNNAAVLRDLYEFLEVAPDFDADMTYRHNSSGGMIANPLLRRVWMGSGLLRAMLRPYFPETLRDKTFSLFARRLVAQPLAPELRAELTELYRPEILKLQDMIKRDLARWLVPHREVTRKTVKEKTA